MFNNATNGYSLTDIAAATGSNRNDNGFGFGGDAGAWWIIILFFLFLTFQECFIDICLSDWIPFLILLLIVCSCADDNDDCDCYQNGYTCGC